MKHYKSIVLAILDGFGISKDKFGSPWEAARHPNFSEIEKNFPFTALQASGLAVGLPWGEAGNSEVGHLTIGAGKIIYNYLPRITTSINDGSFFKNEAFLKTIDHINKTGGSLHIMGLFSSGTVHAYYRHIYALLDFSKQNNVKNVYLHLFTDGRDAYKKEAAKFFKDFENYLEQNYPNAKIASVIGREMPMDRDGNWDKIEKAYNLFVKGDGDEFESASSFIENSYKKDIFDESIEPASAKNKEGRIKDGDAVIFYNFREDSVRQITHAFLNEDFRHFPRKKVNNLLFVTMTEYDKHFSCLVAFKSSGVEWPLARIISENGFSQLHIAEREKYAHITYFLNGGREEVFENENRILVPSPDVASFDLAPEMSAEKVAEEVLNNLKKYNFIAVNFANADMVGHTGEFDATARALETLDKCLGKITENVLETDGALIITSDHGNAEEKLYKLTGEKKTEHSINPVPFYLIANEIKRKEPLAQDKINQEYRTVKGTLADIAPTVLELAGIKKPASMTGKSLLEKII